MNENRQARMLGVKEAAAECGLSYHFVRLLALRGQIPAVRIGRGKIFVNADGLAAYLNGATLTDGGNPARSVGGIRVLGR